MSRAFLKDAQDEPWQGKPSNDEEFAVYWGTGASFEVEPVRRGDDLVSLVRWAYGQPKGHYQIRDRAGRRLAEIVAS